MSLVRCMVLSLTTVVLVVSIALSCLFLLFKAFDFSVNAFGVFGALHGAIFYTVVLVVSIALSCFSFSLGHLIFELMRFGAFGAFGALHGAIFYNHGRGGR